MNKEIRRLCLLAMTLLLVGCNDYTPKEKQLTYDPASQSLVYPSPCPDWSKNASVNYTNATPSNFGCAEQTNMGLQLDDPHDWLQGHGDNRPDTGITTKVIEDYRAGTIPKPLVPMEDPSSSGSSSGAQ